MSADHTTPLVDDGTRADGPDLPARIPADAPIRQIAPDDFVQSWRGTSFRDALRKAEAAPTSTPTIDRGACPACGSAQVTPKSGKYDSEQRAEGAYKCLECGHHCDAPADADDAPGEQATLPGVRER